jgi:tetratricopeptide (TPR) repeat protein
VAEGGVTIHLYLYYSSTVYPPTRNKGDGLHKAKDSGGTIDNANGVNVSTRGERTRQTSRVVVERAACALAFSRFGKVCAPYLCAIYLNKGREAMSVPEEVHDARLMSLLQKYDTNVLAEESDANTQMLNSRPDDVSEQKERMRMLRSDLSVERRLTKANDYKCLANVRFAAGHHRVAISGYLGGLYMLRSSEDVPCPTMVASHLLGLDEVPAFVRASSAPAERTIAMDETRGAMRSALLLNVAAAALKIDEWHLARTACDAVLTFEAKSTKALFRLAKAHEGAGELEVAVAECQRLLRADPQNVDGRKLLESLRKRGKAEAKMFKGCFERALTDNDEGDGLYTRAEEKRDEDDALDRKIEQMRRHAMAASHKPHFEKTYRIPVELANEKLRAKLNKDGVDPAQAPPRDGQYQ